MCAALGAGPRWGEAQGLRLEEPGPDLQGLPG